MKNIRTTFPLMLAGLFVFFGLSLQIQMDTSTSESSEKLYLNLDSLKISLSGVEPAMTAVGDPKAWAGVRAVATFTKNVVDSLDSIISNIAKSGLLNKTAVFTNDDGKHKFKLNPNANVSPSSSAFGTAKTYKNRLDVWDSTTDQKVLELYFDDPSTKSEVLVIWRPKHFDPTGITGNDVIMECGMTGGASSGTMLCSWSGGPLDANGIFDNARIKVVADSANGVVKTIALARIQTAYTAVCPLASASHTVRDYYSLAFIANTKAPNQTTASFGVAENTTNTFCGAANLNNYGRFNTSVNTGETDNKKYYVGDGYSADTAGYPLIADVASLHTSMAGTDAHVSIAKVDAISVLFNSTAGAGF